MLKTLQQQQQWRWQQGLQGAEADMIQTAGYSGPHWHHCPGGGGAAVAGADSGGMVPAAAAAAAAAAGGGGC